ncbi:MAG: multidrug ABC transporter [Chloroflexi bacterium]|nr:multidrug ABC transporter [Chloroflexota bacterium]|tara:strand:+ start:6306 stop:8117 length:1812 start_codon:yes stop_codon:yes gene_type:complete
MNLGLGGVSAARGHADEEYFGNAYDQRVILRLTPFIKPYRKLAIISIIAMLIYTLTLVVVPWMIGYGIDEFIANKDLSRLNILFVIFVIVAVINWITNYIMQYAMQKVGQGVLFGLRKRLFGHVQKQSLSYFDNTEVGRLMSRVQGDVGQLQEFSALVVMSLGELLSLIGIVVALLIMNVKLGLITMIVIPILVVIMIAWQRFAKKTFVEVRRRISIVNGSFNENFAGVRVVQSLNRQKRNLELFDEKNLAHRWSNIVAGRYAAGLLPAVDILTAVAIILAILFGAQMVESQEIGVGVLVAFIMYIQRFFDPIRNLTMQYTQLQRSMASGSRIFDLMDRIPGLEDKENAYDMPEIQGSVEFKNVRFSYVEGEEVLKGINLKIAPGETVAIVGPTGAGKTSIVSVLSRFYGVQPGNGSILVDGIEITDVTRESLVHQMSMVLQEPYLFSGTILENIRYNHSNVSDEQIILAAKAVGAHEFINKLPDGYHTYLAERGNNISLGQRQLISFARAIAPDPKILVLDEATASIDSHTETLIQQALKKVLHGRTAIVIAHRLSTIRGADKIVVLDSGQIVEIGTHETLMAQKHLYFELYNKNFASIEGL